MAEPTGPLRILVIVAHPDDADYAAAGTIAAWTAAGIEVSYCLVTRGESGGFDDAPRERMATTREAEQRAAAAELGVRAVTFLDFADGRVTADLALRRSLTREIRRLRPDRVVCHAPVRDYTRIFTFHPDHLASGEATLCAVYPDARNPFSHTDLAGSDRVPWSVPEVWMVGAPAGAVNHVVDITATFDRKIAALRAHASQTSHQVDLEQRQRDRAASVARSAGLADGRLAEAFQVVDTR